MNFDFTELETKTRADAGVDMPLRSLRGEPMIARDGTPITIKLLGPDSLKYRALTRAQVRKRLAKAQESRAVEFTEADFEETDTDLVGMLAACTVGWTGVLDTEGAPIPFTAVAAQKLFSAYPAIREQCENFMSDRANFSLASSGG